MKREDARALARTLMDAAELTGWRFRFDNARRRAGACTHGARTISLSGPLTDLYDEDTIRGVILHEIAHALVGPAHGHDAAWKRAARALGAPDSARLPSSLPAPDAPWVGTCPRCGAKRRLYRAPRRVSSCGLCSRFFDPALILAWEHHGTPTSPRRAYERELASISGVHLPTS